MESKRMQWRGRPRWLPWAAAAAVLPAALAMLGLRVDLHWAGADAAAPPSAVTSQATSAPPSAVTSQAASVPPPPPGVLTLTVEQMRMLAVQPAVTESFAPSREAVGSIAFNDERSVQVFAPYPGRILSTAARAGEDVRRGQLLFTIDSPDLVQAESALIAAAGNAEVAGRVLQRATKLREIEGIPEKEYEQSVADQQAADAALKAARDAVRIFGKDPAEIDRIVAQRRVDSALPVRSPVDGRVVARSAVAGLYVQPGAAPAPFTVSDLSTLWMLANVAEADVPLLREGEAVEVKVAALPGRTFRAAVVNISAAVDAGTRRATVRCEVRDPDHALRPGMFATFRIRTGKAEGAVAVPAGSLVRDADGSVAVWVRTGERRFERRVVRTGEQQHGLVEILEGVRAGEAVAAEGALFLDNAWRQAS